MRVAIALTISVVALSGCDSTESTKLVEYVADGRAAEIDIAFVAPRGLRAPSDTTFVSGDSTFTSGDTTFVLNTEPTWRYSFEAEEGVRLFLRVTNRTDRNHVSAIVYVDEDYFASDGSDDAYGTAEIASSL